MERRLAAIWAADVVGYSRMMGEDEPATLAAVQSLHSELIDPAVSRHHGRIVKRMGDGVLAEFGSVLEAVQSAIEVQRELASRRRPDQKALDMALRIGVHLGDVITDNDDIYGDSVNIAARLEGVAEAGGICLSRQAYDQVADKLPFAFRSLGPTSLKNIAKPVEVFLLELGENGAAPAPAGPPMRQTIEYCRTPDRVRLAWAKVGEGPPLVRTANWLSHLEYSWEHPPQRAMLSALARGRTLIRYDPRGNGLSDWDVGEISLDAWVGDLATVVDAAGADRFPLFGLSQGCAVSIAYTVRHPERVTKLVLLGGFALGRNKRSPEAAEEAKAMATLMRIGWGTDDAAFRQLFTSRMMPGASKEQADAFNELQRRTTSPDCAVRYFETVNNFDVRDLLPKVSVPTLVMHARGDRMQPFEGGRRLAAGIPGARFVALEGQNHMFLPGEPAARRFLEELELFLAE
jgi:class 3 adenylate cyclase/pimeloyl-ACP methyl ester carboxylesterase